MWRGINICIIINLIEGMDVEGLGIKMFFKEKVLRIKKIVNMVLLFKY